MAVEQTLMRELVAGMNGVSFDASGVLCGINVPEDVVVHDDRLMWSETETLMIDSQTAAHCLWQFVDLADASESRIVRFFSRWGTWEVFGDPPRDDDHPELIADWRDTAKVVRAWLSVFRATQQGVTVEEETLWELRDGMIEGPQRPGYGARESEKLRLANRYPNGDQKQLWRDAKQNVQEQWDRDRRAYIRSMRTSGKGIRLQQELVSGWLGEWTADMPPHPYWRYVDGTRGIGRAAIGVRQIVFTHLIHIFDATDPAIYRCSVCGRLYEWTPSSGTRRPRRDRSTYCSDECREAGKRAANLASWHKHKDEWRKPKEGGKS